MKKEEAIKTLRELWRETNDTWYEEAYDMAIEALENEPIPCERCIHVKSCRKVILLKDKRYKLIRYCSNGVERKKL